MQPTESVENGTPIAGSQSCRAHQIFMPRTIDITSAGHCVVPAHGDVFIQHCGLWPSLGVYGVVFNDPRVEDEDKRRTIPLNFIHELSVDKALGRISVGKPDKHIVLAGRVNLK